MKLSALAGVALLALVWTCPAGSAWCDEPGTQQHKEIEVTVKIPLRYLLFLPEDYEKDNSKKDNDKRDNDKKWPMILFLHGMGESGSDLDKVKAHGPPKIVETKKDFPFIVVSPQCRRPGWNVEALNKLVDHIVAEHQVDTRRIYLTGLSMGGYGSWGLAAAYPDRFAAVAPICGGGNPDAAEKLKNLPIWVFHGDDDRTVPISRSQQMVDSIKESGGENIKFTVYPGVGHDSWTETYKNPKLYEWFLEHKLAKP